jgi:hypothetical protein
MPKSPIVSSPSLPDAIWPADLPVYGALFRSGKSSHGWNARSAFRPNNGFAAGIVASVLTAVVDAPARRAVGSAGDPTVGMTAWT